MIHNKIQVIIGTNGCGKTSLINELFPHATTKNLFDNNGMKSLEVTKDNHDFKIEFKKLKNRKEHSFIMDDKELNENKSFTMQTELIEKYLDLTPNIKSILTSNIDLCNMLPSNRKRLLMQLNPIDTQIIIDKYKKVKSHSNSLKSNLSMLYNRKLKLEQSRINNNEFNEILKNKKKLEKIEQKLLILITKTNTLIEELNNDSGNNQYNEQEFESLKEEIKKLFIISNDFYELNQDEVSFKARNIDNEIDKFNKLNLQLEKDISKLRNELHKKENLKKISLKEKSITEIEQKILALEKEKKKYIDLEITYLFNENDIKEWKKIKLSIIDILNIFIDIYNSDVLDKSTLQKISNKLISINASIDNYKYKSNRIIKEIDINNDKLSIFLNEDQDNEFPIKCDKFNCFLYKRHYREKELITNQLKKLKNQLKYINNKILKYQNSYNKLSILNEKQKQYQELISKLRNMLNSIPITFRLFNREEFVNILNTDPMIIIHKIDIECEKSINYYELNNINETLTLLRKEYNLLKDNEKNSIGFLNEIIKSINNQIEDKQNTYFANVKNIANLKSKEKYYSQYQSYLKIISQIKEKLDSSYIYTKMLLTIKLYKELIDILNQRLTNIRYELNNIIKIIKEQEYLRVRLQEEVLNPIKELEKNKNEYETIEKALFKLTIDYIRSFINNVINNTNFFINKVFTYPMIIKPIEDIDDINFKFEIDINGILVNDISECSAGQKKIINLCFCLSLVVNLNLQHYPFFVDEIDQNLDEKHKYKLLELFEYLIKENIISQLFAVLHPTPGTEGLEGDIIVLNEENILLPNIYNEHVIIKK